MSRPAPSHTVPTMTSQAREDTCPGSRSQPAQLSDDRSTGICPACGRRLPLGYANLLPSHSPLPMRDHKAHVQHELP
jgi:hypothetical protein